MADDFDSFIEKLQHRIFEEAKEALGNWVFSVGAFPFTAAAWTIQMRPFTHKRDMR